MKWMTFTSPGAEFPGSLICRVNGTITSKLGGCCYYCWCPNRPQHWNCISLCRAIKHFLPLFSNFNCFMNINKHYHSYRAIRKCPPRLITIKWWCSFYSRLAKNMVMVVRKGGSKENPLGTALISLLKLISRFWRTKSEIVVVSSSC